MNEPYGVRCPLCGSWYATNPGVPEAEVITSGFEAGDVCGNMAMTGPHPERCTPDHPCPGVLRELDRHGKMVSWDGIAFFNDENALRSAFDDE